ncbi:unnamed protein product [Euphydryas editha]|uniref:Uncharacterized protein n=1 Tax=Euphydryas editha TaxID=104508 RepID=A0AAU9TNB9_EUPED|nr:unnamed protein product [Euphydryas editha]
MVSVQEKGLKGSESWNSSVCSAAGPAAGGRRAGGVCGAGAPGGCAVRAHRSRVSRWAARAGARSIAAGHGHGHDVRRVHAQAASTRCCLSVSVVLLCGRVDASPLAVGALCFRLVMRHVF